MPIARFFRSSAKKNRSSRRRDRANRSSRVASSYHSLEERKLLAGAVAGPVPVSDLVNAPVAAAVFDATPPVARIVDGTEIDADNDPHPSVGIVGDLDRQFCSGTLIAESYVLTAAHCVTNGNSILPDNEGTFEVGGETYGTTRIEVHPEYNDFNFSAGFDIAVFELDRPVNGITPSTLFTAVPTVGQELTLVGFGNGGTGGQGTTADFGTKRFGFTEIEGVSDQHIEWVFDQDESNTAPGDSGGPAFIDVGGELLLAGVTSGGSIDAAAFGGFSFDTRVDIFIDYIDEVMRGRDEHGDLPNATATFIQHGADGTVRTSGRLQSAGDRDVFRVQLRQQSFVTFRVNGLDDIDSYVRLYNSDGLLIAQNNNFDGDNSRLGISVQPGTYYFSVGSFTDAEIGDYNVWSSLRTFGIASPDDHANTLNSDATIYSLDDEGTGRQSGTISTRTDRDVFQVTTQERGTAFIRVNGFNGLDTEVQVFDSLGRSVAFNDDFNGTDNYGLSFRFVPGTYFVAVAASNDRSTGDFSIWSNFRTLVVRDDHGGFVNDSTGISLNSNGRGGASGTITSSLDRDMFFFTATRTSDDYMIRSNGLSNNLDTVVSVFNSAGERIATNDDTFGTNSRVFFSATVGETFYVAVEGKGNSTGKFNLSIFNRG